MKRFQNHLIVGVDTGNFNIKTQTQCFTSGYTELAGSGNTFSDMLDFQGRTFALSGNRIPRRDQKWLTEDFYVLFLFAIGKELRRHGVPSGSYGIIPSVGLPPADFEDSGKKEEMRAYFSKPAKFTYNGTKYTIDASRAVVCPQGFASTLAYSPTERMKLDIRDEQALRGLRPINVLAGEPSGILIDVGGGTVDNILLRYGKPQPSDNNNPPDGTISISDVIRKDLTAKVGVDTSESIINSYLMGENVRIAGEDEAVIQRHLERYAGSLLLRLGEKRLPFAHSYVLMIGGGSRLILPYWRRAGAFGVLDHLDNISANAAGYEEMAYEALLKDGG